MLLLAGIVVAALLILALAAVVERARSREAAEAASALLDRARRRTESHAARLHEVARATAPGTGADDTSDPVDMPSPPTSPPR